MSGDDSRRRCAGARRQPLRRAAWFGAGCIAVAVGLVGVAVPGVPTTGPMLLAAACFARSSARMERWVLGLPGVGQAVLDYRAGLGMPRRAKVLAIVAMLTAVTVSALVVDSTVVRIAVIALGLVGAAYVGWVVPTRERVLAAAHSAQGATA